ncbi:MAG: hypothetical protein LBD58_10850, partial [Treponema sp.]|nr:hypothetical protein [Treponema sp.]
ARVSRGFPVQEPGADGRLGDVVAAPQAALRFLARFAARTQPDRGPPLSGAAFSAKNLSFDRKFSIRHY